MYVYIYSFFSFSVFGCICCGKCSKAVFTARRADEIASQSRLSCGRARDFIRIQVARCVMVMVNVNVNVVSVCGSCCIFNLTHKCGCYNIRVQHQQHQKKYAFAYEYRFLSRSLFMISLSQKLCSN